MLRLKDVVLGEKRPRIIVSLTGETGSAMAEQARRVAVRADVDIAELRIDHLHDALDPDAVAALVPPVVASLGGKPLLATFRSAREGGEKAVEPTRYAAIYEALIGGGIDLIDLELAMLASPEVAAVQARARSAGVPVMLSHHDFGDTPATERMLAILEDEARRGADICKLAVMPKDAGDVVRLLDATWRMRQRQPDRLLLTIAMGGVGAVSRASGEVFGSALTFASVGGGGSAPGQVDTAELKQMIDTLGRALETTR